MSRKPQAPGAILPPLSTLVGPRKVAPAGTEEPGEAAEAGSRSCTAFARSLQTAEALLRHCIHPSLRRLLPLQPSQGPEDNEEEEEEASLEALAHLAQVERSFLALSRSLSVREDLRTETFQGRVRPEPAQPAFSYHATRSSTARHCATLHALLQQHHYLHLARHYSRRLKAASDFVRRLWAAEASLLPPSGRQDAAWGGLLRGLCEELRAHTAHWDALQRHLRGDPWLRPLLLQRHESVWHMRQAFSSLARQALCLTERCLEALLRRLAHTPCPPPALLSDFFQGLDIYNQVMKDQPWQHRSVALWAEPGSDWPGEPGRPSPFPVERVLGLLAAERGQQAAGKLHRFLGLQAEASGVEAVPWEGGSEAWLLDAAPPAGEGAPSLSAELQALGQGDEEHLFRVLGELVASTGSLWHQVLSRPKQERPPEGSETSSGPQQPDAHSLPAWKAVRWLDASYSEAARALYAQYRPLVWSATATALAHQLELHPPLAQSHTRMVAILGQQLGRTPFHACIPQESTEELRGLLLRLLVRGALQHWDRDFCHVLGYSLTDKCVATLSQATATASSHTAQLLYDLFPPLACSLRSLDAWSPGSTADHLLGPVGCRSALLSLSVAASQASCYWVFSKASQFLASGSLSLFLLITQGDLQLLMAEVSRMAALVDAAPSGSGSLLATQQEQSQQVSTMAASLQHFAKDALRLFSSECKRMSAEIFGQTMPLGKHWRLPLQTDVPSSPSEYASAAVQAVLGQVLQGIRPLPREAQEPALSQVITAFLEAWMDHILAQEIKFSLHGALQLKLDFELVRELLQAEESGLSAESRQRVLSLRVFQQADNAITCLLQQPNKASLPCQTWGALCQCCSYSGIHTQASGPGSLNSLESLEGLPARGRAAGDSQAGDLLGHGQGAGCSPETYLSSPQQEWLALRLHGGRRWKMPGLPCVCGAVEP